MQFLINGRFFDLNTDHLLSSLHESDLIYTSEGTGIRLDRFLSNLEQNTSITLWPNRDVQYVTMKMTWQVNASETETRAIPNLQISSQEKEQLYSFRQYARF